MLKVPSKQYIVHMKYIILTILLALAGCGSRPTSEKEERKENVKFEIQKTEEEWKKELTPEQYFVLREKGTERPFTGKFDDHWDKGIYKCAGCGEELFQSETKFDAGCGWPSFYDAIDKEKVLITKDYSHGMIREEVQCKKCGAHLGHVFDDGPKPTGKRYCINSISIDFKEK